MKRTTSIPRLPLDTPLRILFLFVFFVSLCLNSFTPTVTVTLAQTTGFTAGDLVVYRVGDGTAALTSNATPVFLDEFSITGTKVLSVSLPITTANGVVPLTAAGTSTSEGLMTRSTDGKYLIVPGYKAASGTTSPASASATTIPRILGKVDSAGNLDFSTAITDATANIRSAASTDGNGLYGGASSTGLRYATSGATTSTQVITTPTNIRQVGIFDNQLYFSAMTGNYIGINVAGSGLPTTTNQMASNIISPTNAGSPYGFQFFDTNNLIAGLDTAYVADDRSNGNGGIQRWDYNGTWWSLAYTMNSGLGTGSGSGLRGLVGVNISGTVTLYGTTTESSANRLVKVTDSGVSSVFSVLATAPINTAFRGVAFTPEGSSNPTPTNPSGTGSASPSVVQQSQQVTLTVSVTPGTNPASTGLTVTADLTSIGGSANQSFNGSGNTFTYVATIPPGQTDGNISIPFTITDDQPRSGSGNIAFSVNAAGICGGTFTPTYSIQGVGVSSPYSGTTQTVQGVVTGGLKDDNGENGFYIQDPTGDSNTETSDGLFIYNAGQNNIPTPGQVVRLTGVVKEYFTETELSLTSGGYVNCGTTQTIPAPVEVSLPITGTASLEKYESMLVTLPQNLYVSETFQLGRFNQVTMSSGDRLRQPTELYNPGPDAIAAQAANDLNQIVVDDQTLSQNVDPITFSRGTYPAQQLTAANTLRIGDRGKDITGIMTWEWGGTSASPNTWRVRVTQNPTFTAENIRPTEPEDVGGTLKVAGMNLLNFFNDFSGCTLGVGGASTDCRGADNANEFTRQVGKTLPAIEATGADVIAFSEIENNGYGSNSAIQYLVDQLNTHFGANTYAFINPDTTNGLNSLGTDAIKVGILYKPAKVTPTGDTAVLNIGAFGQFSVSGPVTQTGRNRPPLAQSFKQNSNNQAFTVVANHLKSKGSTCDSNISPAPNDTDVGDGQGSCNQTRKLAAQEETTWLQSDPTGSNTSNILILGDMNSYAREDPIKAFEAGNYVNLIENLIGEDAYSFVFDGQSGYLDHALASPDLAPQVTGVTEFHNNADEPTVLDYNTDFKTTNQKSILYAANEFRASDHDPVIVGLNLGCLQVEKEVNDGSCGSLTNAINSANSIAASQPVTISFNLTSTITVTSTLPTITGTNTITVGTACSATPGPKVQILAGNGITTGFTLGDNAKLSNLSVTGFSGTGVSLTGNKAVIACSQIGTADGMTASGNGTGIRLTSTSSNTSIGISGDNTSGNLISGNTGNGILVEAGSTGNEAYYNLIGWQSNGTVPLQNGSTAVKVSSGGTSGKPTLKFGPGNRISAKSAT